MTPKDIKELIDALHPKAEYFPDELENTSPDQGTLIAPVFKKANVLKRLNRLRARMDIYNLGIPFDPKHQKHWNNFIKHWDKLQIAAQVCAESNKLSLNDQKSIGEFMLGILELELAKLEAKFLKELHTQGSLEKEKQLERNKKFKDKMTEKLKAELPFMQEKIQLLILDNKKDAELRLLRKRFKKLTGPYQKDKTSLKQHLKRVGVASDVTKGSKIGSGLILTLSATFPHAIKIGQALWGVFQSIGLIAAITSIVNISLHSISTFLSKKSSTVTKSITGTIFSLTIAGIIISSLIPPAAPIIACTIIGIGLITTQIAPWFSTRAEIKKKEALYSDIQNKNWVGAEPPASLDENDKYALKHLIEKYWVKKLNPEQQKAYKKVFMQAIADINNSKLAELESNDLINQALNNYPLKNYLADKRNKHLVILNKEITELKGKQNKQLAKTINGVFTLIAAILICVPTPPTIAAGAALIALTSAASLIIEYDVPRKIKNFVLNLFKSKPKEEAEAPKHDFKLRDEVELNLKEVNRSAPRRILTASLNKCAKFVGGFKNILPVKKSAAEELRQANVEAPEPQARALPKVVNPEPKPEAAPNKPRHTL